MKTDYSYSDYIKNPFLAAEEIGNFLHHGSLVLFLGAGASQGFGLPSWVDLVALIMGKGGDKDFIKDLAQKSNKEIAKLIDEVDDNSDTYINKVHDALYSQAATDLNEQLSKSPLLLSVAALLTGSCRGRVSSVITYNYDNLLKQYLDMLGYSVCIRTEPSQLMTWADVDINYIHGYLPQSKKGASKPGELILSEKSYRMRRALIDKGWSSYVEHGLYTKIGLFLGLSGEDSAILDVLKRAQVNIKRTEDYTGYWLMTPSAYDRNSKDILDVGMCPIKLEEKDFPRFVFAVCQNALKCE